MYHGFYMAIPLRSPLAATPLGPGHFKAVVGPDSELRIEPRGHFALAVATAFVIGAVIAVLWFVPGVPLGVRVAMSILGCASGAALFAFFAWLHSHERQHGPYLVVNREGINVRGGRRVLLGDFGCFEIARRWEPTGDGETKVSYLVLRCKSGEEIEVLVSVIHREVAKLKRALDEKLGDILASGTRH
jgi:hypothetical protein